MTHPVARRWSLWAARGGRGAALVLLVAWLAACATLLAISWLRITELGMWDADDFMRLQQVRDWMAGQAWFDVSQHRLNPPYGFAMHWSRLVDLPLAAGIAALRPFVGQATAEIATAAVVPLLTLGVVLTFVTLLTRRLAGDRIALFAPVLGACCALILFQTLPLRIDHHGWQLACGAATVYALLDRDARRSGALAGAITALWLNISLESLPMAAAIGALLGLRWVLGAEHETRFRTYLIALSSISLLLFGATHSPAAWAVSVCDSISSPHLAIFACAALCAGLGAPWLRGGGPVPRALAAGALGLVFAGLYAGLAPQCLAGPFAQLDPLARVFWYDNVLEGLPVWKQDIGFRGLLLIYPLLGLAGHFLGWRRAETAEARRDWATLMILAAAAYGVSILVQRAGGLAHLLALPGAALLARLWFDRARAISVMPVRVFATVAAVVLASPIAASWGGSALFTWAAGGEKSLPATKLSCAIDCRDYETLDRLPPSFILAPIDVGPRLLVNTPHRYLTAGYHRNGASMALAIRAFTGPPEFAHRLMLARGMRYVLIQPQMNEATTYSRAAPDGLMARLRSGRAPDWLEPVPLERSIYKLWRLRDQGRSRLGRALHPGGESA